MTAVSGILRLWALLGVGFREWIGRRDGAIRYHRARSTTRCNRYGQCRGGDRRPRPIDRLGPLAGRVHDRVCHARGALCREDPVRPLGETARTHPEPVRRRPSGRGSQTHRLDDLVLRRVVRFGGRATRRRIPAHGLPRSVPGRGRHRPAGVVRPPVDSVRRTPRHGSRIPPGPGRQDHGGGDRQAAARIGGDHGDADGVVLARILRQRSACVRRLGRGSRSGSRLAISWRTSSAP